jgi:hypothetical protein
VKPLGYWTGEWFFAQCDCGLSGWYAMFYAGQYVVEGKANCLGGADMQVRSQFDLRAERMIGCQTVFAAERTNSSACTYSSLVCDRRNFVKICSNCNICFCCRQRYRANCNRGQTSGLWFCKQEFDDSMT